MIKLSQLLIILITVALVASLNGEATNFKKLAVKPFMFYTGSVPFKDMKEMAQKNVTLGGFNNSPDALVTISAVEYKQFFGVSLTFLWTTLDRNQSNLKITVFTIGGPLIGFKLKVNYFVTEPLPHVEFLDNYMVTSWG